MVEVSERVRRRVRADFPHQADQVLASLKSLTQDISPDEAADSFIERIQVATLILARGHLRRLDEAVALGRTDWRDLLVAAGLADKGWQDRVEAELAPTPATHIWITRRTPGPR